MATRMWFELFVPACETCGRGEALQADCGFSPEVDAMFKQAGMPSWSAWEEKTGAEVAKTWQRVYENLNTNAAMYAKLADWHTYASTMHSMSRFIEYCKQMPNGVVKARMI